MNLEILSIGEASTTQLETFRRLPSFRKATRAMTLACASIEATCAQSEKIAKILKENPERFGLVVGSAFGELETTKDFLKTFSDTGLARPVLFQNSLHNSTSGFASIHFHFTGPVITVSHGLFAFENSLEVANLLLTQRQADLLIVTYVETVVPDLATQTAELSTVGITSKVVDLSLSVLLTTPQVCAAENLLSLGTIDDVSCHRSLGAPPPSYSSACNAGAAAVETLRDELKKKSRHANSSHPSKHEFSVSRSSDAYSRFKWSHD